MSDQRKHNTVGQVKTIHQPVRIRVIKDNSGTVDEEAFAMNRDAFTCRETEELVHSTRLDPGLEIRDADLCQGATAGKKQVRKDPA